ncbi:heavy-metal-associated domain-containing protein [Psychroserpens sp. MEBiC05023]
MRTTIIIQSLKCDNCRPTVLSALDRFKGISNVVIDSTMGHLTFDCRSHNIIEGLRVYLKDIGHPITKDSSLINNISK